MNLYIAVGSNSRIQKRCTILQTGDVIAIPYLGGAVEIQFINETTIKISGTNSIYLVREIISREWIDRPWQQLSQPYSIMARYEKYHLADALALILFENTVKESLVVL